MTGVSTASQEDSCQLEYSTVVHGGEALGPTNNGDKQWTFPNVEISDKEKRMIVGEIIYLGLEILFTTHCYSFKGKLFKQEDGGPIGLSNTYAIARFVLGRHSQKWRAAMAKNNVKIAFDRFYVDDGRIVMFSLRTGWRCCDNGLWVCEEWALEDIFKSPTQRTKDAMMGSLDGLIECLRFTVEAGEEFDQYWLHTLDLR